MTLASKSMQNAKEIKTRLVKTTFKIALSCNFMFWRSDYRTSPRLAVQIKLDPDIGINNCQK